MAGRPLFLTTPLLRGEDVRALQQALQTPRRPDLAGRRLPERRPTGGSGKTRTAPPGRVPAGYARRITALDSLVAFLNGTTAPTQTMTVNRRRRLAAAKKEPRGLKRVREAVKQRRRYRAPARQQHRPVQHLVRVHRPVVRDVRRLLRLQGRDEGIRTPAALGVRPGHG